MRRKEEEKSRKKEKEKKVYFLLSVRLETVVSPKPKYQVTDQCQNSYMFRQKIGVEHLTAWLF